MWGRRREANRVLWKGVSEERVRERMSSKGKESHTRERGKRSESDSRHDLEIGHEKAERFVNV